MKLSVRIRHLSVFVDDITLAAYKEYCRSIGKSMHLDILNHISNCIDFPKRFPDLDNLNNEIKQLLEKRKSLEPYIQEINDLDNNVLVLKMDKEAREKIIRDEEMERIKAEESERERIRKDEIKLMDAFNNTGLINRTFGDNVKFPNITKREYGKKEENTDDEAEDEVYDE